MKIRNIVAALFFTLSIYSFAGGALLGLVNYPTWKLLNPAEFPAFHQAVDKPIGIFFIPFYFLFIVVSVVLIWFHPPAMSRSWIVVSAVLNLFIWIVTVTMAIPIHKQLDHGYSAALIDRLVMVHVYLRVIPGVFATFVAVILLYQVLRAASR